MPAMYNFGRSLSVNILLYSVLILSALAMINGAGQSMLLLAMSSATLCFVAFTLGVLKNGYSENAFSGLTQLVVWVGENFKKEKHLSSFFKVDESKEKEKQSEELITNYTSFRQNL